MAALAEATAGKQLIVRVDRTELSKNIVRGLEAYRELLRTRPEWHRKVVHFAFAYPSRHDLPEYREYTAAVQRMARQIEDEFAEPGWEPLLLEVNDDYPRSLAACRLADVMLVNPIRDGMNLVAKEGPILADRGCALVLSTEAGAAAELGDDALMVNPFDVSQTAQALHRALAMGADERKRRSEALAAAAAAMPPSRWFCRPAGRTGPARGEPGAGQLTGPAWPSGAARPARRPPGRPAARQYRRVRRPRGRPRRRARVLRRTRCTPAGPACLRRAVAAPRRRRPCRQGRHRRTRSLPARARWPGPRWHAPYRHPAAAAQARTCPAPGRARCGQPARPGGAQPVELRLRLRGAAGVHRQRLPLVLDDSARRCGCARQHGRQLGPRRGHARR